MIASPPAYTLRHGDVLVLALTSRPQPEAFLVLDHWQPTGLLGHRTAAIADHHQ